jgi:hypothetical protein
LIILAGYFLFAMKREVEALNLGFRSLSSQIRDERSAINLLKAEFSHLTSPARLKLLADTHLDLSNINPKMMVSDPLRGEEDLGMLANNTKTKAEHTKKWRYKHMGERNIHKASYRINVR